MSQFPYPIQYFSCREFEAAPEEIQRMLEYLSRQRLDNPALRLVQKMLNENNLNELPEVQEAILKLSQELAKIKGE